MWSRGDILLYTYITVYRRVYTAAGSLGRYSIMVLYGTYFVDMANGLRTTFMQNPLNKSGYRAIVEYPLMVYAQESIEHRAYIHIVLR